jgi:hypothetical protein
MSLTLRTPTVRTAFQLPADAAAERNVKPFIAGIAIVDYRDETLRLDVSENPVNRKTEAALCAIKWGSPMTQAEFRILFISDQQGIDALSRAAAEERVAIESVKVPESDQKLALATMVAVATIVYKGAQAAELLVRAYKEARSKKVFTLKTPKGAVTIEGDDSTKVEDILKEIEDAGIF